MILSKAFQYKSSYEIGNDLYKLYFKISILLAIVSIFIINPIELKILSFLTNIIIAYTFKIRFFKKIPVYLFLGFNTILYFQVPIVYVSTMNELHAFDTHLLMPKSDSFYNNYIFTACIVYLITYFILILGLGFGNKIKIKPISFFSNVFNKTKTINYLLILAIIAFFINFIDLQSIFESKILNQEKKENFFKLIFNDRFFSILFCVIFYRFPPSKNSKKFYLSIVFLFFLLMIYAGSKAAILLIFLFFFLVPVCVYYNSDVKIYWPSKKMLLFFVVIAPLLFLFSMAYRIIINTPVVQELLSFSSLSLLASSFEFAELCNLIFSRFSVTLNNYIAIYSSFFDFESLAYRLTFLEYTFKGTLNLLLPGTPYPESYVPSSQLLNNVLSMQQLEPSLDKVSLLVQANTQPYTLFGWLTILFGPLSIFISFFFGFLSSILYNFIHSDFIKGCLIIIISGFLILYSIEVQIQISVFIIASCTILYLCLLILDKLKKIDF